EIIYLIIKAIHPELAIIPVPTFTEYERALRLANSRIKFLFLKEEQNFALNPDELIKMAKNVQMIILCNPNNPTGKLLLRNEMQRIVDEAKKMGKFVLIDESFIDFQLQHSLIDRIKTNQNIFILRSFTKFFSIAGLRLGYGVANKKLIAKIKSIKQPWTVNSLAEVAGIQILENIEKAEKLKVRIENERDFLYKNLFKIDEIEPYPSATNFILIKIKSFFSSSWLSSELAKRGILIRDCSNFPGLSDKFIRVAVRKREENKKLIYNLEQILGSKV
ncbi:aminotransferase class I/II-fold pyridoxal phosphate-dependent enzyme, partial [Patescibacteria group bacterium]|nr:aminotransferase class I/II-fold pyridoxal phosphate-dependent enzyme [Patescibacteria group bacterium]